MTNESAMLEAAASIISTMKGVYRPLDPISNYNLNAIDVELYNSAAKYLI
jgi:cytoplasmic iron level regulating protein YaaA (DUF328/UPF0246 family)